MAPLEEETSESWEPNVSGSTACINEQRTELQTITLIRHSKGKERNTLAYRRFHSCRSYPRTELSSALNAWHLIEKEIFFPPFAT